jgi:SAM-dependent methyltransferase
LKEAPLVEESNFYLMENEEESIRLDVKTDPDAVRKQALWCGVKAGLRVLDAGCGPGRTTSILHAMLEPGGSIIGVDYSAERINDARKHYGGQQGMDFVLHDLRKPMKNMGTFDVIWVRFVLEYNRKESREIVRYLRDLLRPGGYLCLIDLDYNCLNHYELPAAIGVILPKLMAYLDEEYNFDTFAGRKLYSYLYDHHFENIQMELMAHHLIYGQAREADIFNWLKKIEVSAHKLETLFAGYPGGSKAFMADFKKFFLDPRRFTYTPLIMGKGMRPYAD